MIVVAIIGILAAVAIPGFMSYIKNSKTSEAKTNIDAVKTGALAYYQAEHYDDTGLKAITKNYPQGDGQKKVGPASTARKPGIKNSPSDYSNDMLVAPWSDLKFSIQAPFYYTYYYNADGNMNCTGAGTEASPRKCEFEGATITPSHFQIAATASLSGDADSTFCLNGYSDGSTGGMLEANGNTCLADQAKVPSDPE